MKRALIISKNLIGDALSISPALNAWHKAHPNYQIDLWTLPDHVAALYPHMGVPMVRVVTEERQLRYPYDFEFKFDVNIAFQIGAANGCHITEAYAAMLNVKIESKQPVYIPHSDYVGGHERGFVLISPFSRSCSSQSGGPPNKMLPWPIWKLLVRELERDLGRVFVLGAAENYADELGLPLARYITGEPLNNIALILRDARLLVTIDNGIAHLAASQNTWMTLFYPMCLGVHWILPENPNLVAIQVDPANVPSMDVLRFVRQVIKATRERGVRDLSK